MKDIYELLNEANVDASEIEEMEVSELERKRGKKKLMVKVKEQKRNATPKSGRTKIAIVASILVVIGASTIFISKPAWAMNIPIIGDLIQNNLININSKYKDYIQAVGQTKSDQGIDITFESAIADRNVLNLSFIVRNNNESIENNYSDALVIPTSLKVNNESVSAGSGASYEVIDKNTIKVLKYINWEQEELDEYLNVDIEISEMFGKLGNWDVSFVLDTKEVEKNTYVEKLNKVISRDSIDYNLNEITITPLTTSINFDYIFNKTPEQIENYSLEGPRFMIFDQNGKEVMWTGGTLPINENKGEGQWKYINNEKTEKLDIIPYYFIKSSKEERKLDAIKINVNEFSPINIKLNEDVSIKICNFIIDGDYAIIEYYYIYLDKIVNRVSFSDIYVNVDGKSESEIENESGYKPDLGRNKLYEKYGENFNDEKTTKIVKIGDSKDIEIGVYDGSSIEILKDEAFTVIKK